MFSTHGLICFRYKVWLAFLSLQALLIGGHTPSPLMLAGCLSFIVPWLSLALRSSHWMMGFIVFWRPKQRHRFLLSQVSRIWTHPCSSSHRVLPWKISVRPLHFPCLFTSTSRSLRACFHSSFMKWFLNDAWFFECFLLCKVARGLHHYSFCDWEMILK